MELITHSLTTVGQDIVRGTFYYGVIHLNWLIIKKLYKSTSGQARKLRNQTIKHHVKAGHDAPLYLCHKGECASLQNPSLALSQPPAQ